MIKMPAKTSENKIEVDFHLLEYMLRNEYKAVCDKIKEEIIDSFIKLAREHGDYIHVNDLECIKKGINDLRNKEKEKELNAIVSVIDSLIQRGNVK